MKIPCKKIALFTLLLFFSIGNVMTSWAKVGISVETIIAEYEKQFPFMDILDFEMLHNETESQQFEGFANYALKENIYACYMQFPNHIVLKELKSGVAEEPLFIFGDFYGKSKVSFTPPQFYSKEQALMLDKVPLFISINNKKDDLNHASDKLSSFYEQKNKEISNFISQLDFRLSEIEKQINLVEHDFTRASQHDKLIAPYRYILSDLNRKHIKLISQRTAQMEKYRHLEAKGAIEALSEGEYLNESYCLESYEFNYDM
ncbi:hypothetical protein [Thorsellia anophelis]|nr:hypothetical protein [Thorsellia anophelis]